MIFIVPRRAKQLTLPDQLETIGQRLARIRKEKGYTQIELAEKVGLVQAMISDYEVGKLRVLGETAIQLAKALGISTDELLGLKKIKSNGKKLTSRLRRRMDQIQTLPPHKQKTLLTTIDAFIKGMQA